MIGNLYLITNKINNKKYVGKTYKSIEERFKEHIKESKNKTKIHRPLFNAINKYGTENFKIELLGQFEDGLLEEKEIEFIKAYDTYNNGYNATIGGDGHRNRKILDKQILLLYKELLNVSKVSKKVKISNDYLSLILKNYNIPVLSSPMQNILHNGKEIIQKDETGKIINIFYSKYDVVEYLKGLNHKNEIENKKQINLLLKSIQRKTIFHNYFWEYKDKNLEDIFNLNLFSPTIKTLKNTILEIYKQTDIALKELESKKIEYKPITIRDYSIKKQPKEKIKYKKIKPKDNCPECGKLKCKESKLCIKCYSNQTKKQKNIPEEKILTKTCPICNKLIDDKLTYCSQDCLHKSQEKTNKPTKEELKNLIQTSSFTQIGKKFGVTDNAIRKWCKSYLLPFSSSQIKTLTQNDWIKLDSISIEEYESIFLNKKKEEFKEEDILNFLEQNNFNITKATKEFKKDKTTIKKIIIKNNLQDKIQTPENRKKKIAQIKNGEIIKIFDSIDEAEKIYGRGVRHVLLGKNKTCKGFEWQYYNDKN